MHTTDPNTESTNNTANTTTAPTTIAPTTTAPTRRLVVAGALVAVGGAALVACGGGDDKKDDKQDDKQDAKAPAADKTLGAATDVPVGGGKVYEAEKVVVTQPTAGDFKAFSAVCTHQQCLVTSVAKGEIVCPCHGSRFDAATGQVRTDPATKALPARTIQVTNGQIVLKPA